MIEFFRSISKFGGGSGDRLSETEGFCTGVGIGRPAKVGLIDALSDLYTVFRGHTGKFPGVTGFWRCAEVFFASLGED